MSSLLTASLLLAVLWPAYFVLLRYSNRFTLNRLLIMLGLVAVCSLPFLSLPTASTVVTTNLRQTIDRVETSVIAPDARLPEQIGSEIAPTTTEATTATPTMPPTTPLKTIYLLGAGVLLLTLLIRLLLLLSLHLRSRPNKAAAYRILPASATPGQAFTFGRHVYFSAEVPEQDDFAHILAHERVHARQFHSFDILLSELFLCIFWFHPAAWWLRAQLRANLEYLVDQTIIKNGTDRRSYQYALVRQSQHPQGLALALPFSEPSLKDRIVRMTGMNQYRLVGLTAAVFLLFWMGIAMSLISGSDQASVHPAPLAESATEVNVGSEFSAFFDGGAAELNLYFKRLPTPDEVAGIRPFLEPFPAQDLLVFQDCTQPTGHYSLHLGEPQGSFNGFAGWTPEVRYEKPVRLQLTKDGKGGTGRASFRPQPLPAEAPDADIILRINDTWVTLKSDVTQSYTAENLDRPVHAAEINCLLGLTPDNVDNYNRWTANIGLKANENLPTRLEEILRGNKLNDLPRSYFIGAQEVSAATFLQQPLERNARLYLGARTEGPADRVVVQTNP